MQYCEVCAGGDVIIGEKGSGEGGQEGCEAS